MEKNNKSITELQNKAIQAIINATDEELERAMRLFQDYYRNGENNGTTKQRTNT